MKTSLFALITAAATGVVACGGGPGVPAKNPDGSTIQTPDGTLVTQAAANKFKQGLASIAKHDKANDWGESQCAAVGKTFRDANDEQPTVLLQALYNSGIAHQRCKQDAQARKVFESILSKNAGFHRARVQVALYKYAADGDVEAAMAQLKRAIADAKFKNEEALVNLAMFQMMRGSSEGDSGCENDFDCAKLNLQRALAINDSFMPAFNQLSVYYLELAKRKAGAKRGRRNIKAASGSKKKADTQALELAALVISQALRKNPRYAPLFNTSGLISSELDDLSSAAKAFGKARKFDPKFFEAHMNYAAVNLQFRGFKRAEDAYRKALQLRPKDYEAYLGLALALRGQIGRGQTGKVKAVETLLSKAKALSPKRPEAYYNEAILVQEFRANGPKSEKMLLKAKGLFNEFRSRAEGKSAFKEAVKRATERMEEIDQIVEFNRQSAEDQKRMEAMQRAAEAKKQLKQGTK